VLQANTALGISVEDFIAHVSKRQYSTALRISR